MNEFSSSGLLSVGHCDVLMLFIISTLLFRPPDDQVDTKEDDPVVKRSRLTPEDLRAHIPEVSRDDPGTACPYCGKGLGSKARLKIHIMSVHRPKAHLPCPVCDKLIKENILAGHIGDIHLDRKVSAPCRVKGCAETFQMDKG